MTSNPDAASSLMRGRIKLRHLRLMLVLDEARSITRAAERLCISQAAVSKTRSELEAGIGTPLFIRRNGRLELTEAGSCVLRSARRIIAELESLGEEMAAMKGGMRGVLSIGMRSISAELCLAVLTRAYKDKHPDLTIRLIDADLPSLLDRLARGDISLVVGRVDSEHLPERIETHVILADPNVVIASPRHPLVRRAKVDWPELVRHRWCLTPVGFAGRFSREHLTAHLRRLALPFPSDLIEPTSFLMIVTLLQAGDFLTLVPQGVARQLARRGLAHLVKVPPVGTADPVCLMWPSDMPLPPAARQFRDFAIAALKTEDGTRSLGVELQRPALGRRFGFMARTPLAGPFPATGRPELRGEGRRRKSAPS